MLAEAALALAAIYLVPALLLALYISYRIARPHWHQPRPGGCTHTPHALPPSWKGALMPGDLNLRFSAVRIPAAGGSLSAWLIPPRGSTPARTAVACVHGAGRDRRAWLRHAAFLAAAGADVLLVDCLSHGLSDAAPGPPITLGRREGGDVVAAVAFLRDRGARHVVVLATSQGAAAAVAAAAQGDALDLLVLENPFASPTALVRGVVNVIMERVPVPGYAWLLSGAVEWLALWQTGNLPREQQVSAERLVGEVQVPVFFVHGTEDIIVNCKQSQLLFEKVNHERKELWLVEGAAHTHCHFTQPKLFEEKVLAFMKKYLGDEAFGDQPLIDIGAT